MTKMIMTAMMNFEIRDSTARQDDYEQLGINTCAEPDAGAEWNDGIPAQIQELIDW